MKLSLRPGGIRRPFELTLHERQDLVSDMLRRDGIWEPFETKLVVGALREGDVFVDVGANIGYYTLLASRLVGARGRVLAFEPEPANFELLRRNCEAHDVRNIALFPCGLSDAHSDVPLYLSHDNLGDHRVFDEGGRERIQVRMERGDDVLSTEVDRIDFLKIDTQGAEYHVVKGLEGMIGTRRGSLRMIVEYWPWGLAAAGASARALIETLAQFGLRFHLIDHIGNRLNATDPAALIALAEHGDLRPESRGFVNLYLDST